MANLKRPTNWEGYQPALGVYTKSKKDFINKMKGMGCDFTDKVKVKDLTPPPYEASKWARDMISTSMQCKRGKKSWKPGDRFMDQLKQNKITKEKHEEAQKLARQGTVGGFK